MIEGAFVGYLIALRLAGPGSIEDCPHRILAGGMLVAMSRSSLVVRVLLRPSLWTKDSHVLPDKNAPTTSASATLGTALHSFEKRRMYSRRDSLGFYRQFLRPHEFPGRSYVPWKLPTKIYLRSAQSWILLSGRCSSHVRAESARYSGRLRMMKPSLCA